MRCTGLAFGAWGLISLAPQAIILGSILGVTDADADHRATQRQIKAGDLPPAMDSHRL